MAGRILQITSTVSRFRSGSSLIILISVVLLLAACATRPYHHDSTNSFPIRERALTQTEGGITVSASVPGVDEAQAIFGIPIYKSGIQPVWLEVENNSPDRVRFAPTGMDREYFSPMEVAYMHRKGFTREARAQMEQRFYHSAMPRQIPAGESRSGYVFTHASPGTKSFDVDVFAGNEDKSFAFFVTVPGFVPDHREVDFESLYEASEIRDLDLSGLRAGLTDLPWFSTDQSGEQPGLPVSLIFIGQGRTVLKALLRAGWHETPKLQDAQHAVDSHYLFGRKPDATFRIQRDGKKDRNELNLWLAPMRIEGEAVWLAQIIHFIGQRTQLEQAIFGARVDPDVDASRYYLMQNLWYTQSLAQIGWLEGSGAVSVENARFDFKSLEYFTDGFRTILWLSEEPVSLLKTTRADLDGPPIER